MKETKNDKKMFRWLSPAAIILAIFIVVIIYIAAYKMYFVEDVDTIEDVYATDDYYTTEYEYSELSETYFVEYKEYTVPDDPVAEVTQPAFDGDSQQLKSTQIVATLDTPITPGRNVIWCSSFQSAWKSLETDLLEEPPVFTEMPEIVGELNRAADPRPDIPAECIYTKSGYAEQGIIEQITEELAEQFPEKTPPDFSDIMPDSFVAYSFLEANVQFAIPYFQYRTRETFTDTSGKETPVSFFGIRPKDEYAFDQLRCQPKIYTATRDDKYTLTDCILELDRNSTPNQIILALVQQKSTLAEMIEDVRQQIRKPGKLYSNSLGPNDTLMVPDMVWAIQRRYQDLEGLVFQNAKLSEQTLDRTRQDIRFCLNRSGAELDSEAIMECLPVPTDYNFNQPFLLIMKKRDAKQPFFVMWVDNAELLNQSDMQTDTISDDEE